MIGRDLNLQDLILPRQLLPCMVNTGGLKKATEKRATSNKRQDGGKKGQEKDQWRQKIGKKTVL